MKVRVSVFFMAVAVGIMIATMAYAGQPSDASATPDHKIVRDSDLKWTPLIKGNELAVVSGDPSKDGDPYVVRIRTASGAKIPAHWHPADEYVTVLKGTFLLGVGDRFDQSKLEAIQAGAFAYMPKEMRHFASAKGETIVQVHGIGPFKVNWVNPAEVAAGDSKK